MLFSADDLSIVRSQLNERKFIMYDVKKLVTIGLMSMVTIGYGYSMQAENTEIHTIPNTDIQCPTKEEVSDFFHNLKINIAQKFREQNENQDPTSENIYKIIKRTIIEGYSEKDNNRKLGIFRDKNGHYWGLEGIYLDKSIFDPTTRFNFVFGNTVVRYKRNYTDYVLEPTGCAGYRDCTNEKSWLWFTLDMQREFKEKREDIVNKQAVEQCVTVKEVSIEVK